MHLYLRADTSELAGWTAVREPATAIAWLARGTVVEASLAYELAGPVLDWMERAVAKQGFFPPPARIEPVANLAPLPEIDRVAKLRYAALRQRFAADEGMQLHEERILVCEVLSDLFIEACNHGDDELDEIAPYLARSSFSLAELDRIAKRDFCGAMWSQAIGALLTGGLSLPLFGWPDGRIRSLVESNLARRRAWKLLPFWWIGYGIARWFLRGAWNRLRARVEQMRAE